MRNQSDSHLPYSPAVPVWRAWQGLLMVLGGLVFLTLMGSYKILTIPPVHSDEAWFGRFAYRIATEPGFWPSAAMNSYTGPILHYLMAVAFHFFGPSVETSRGLFLFLNGLGFSILSFTLLRLKGLVHLFPFSVFFVLLPVSQFSLRIQLEVTTWFLVCYSLVLFSLSYWNRNSKWASFGVALGIGLGMASHVLFFIVPVSIYLVLLLRRPELLRSREAKVCLSAVFLPAACVPLRMALGLHEPFAWMMAFSFFYFGVSPWIQVINPQRYLQAFNRSVNRSLKWIFSILFGLPIVAASLVYFIFEFSGIWPYAQITGQLKFFWFPLNLVFLGWVVWSSRGIFRFSQKDSWLGDLVLLFLFQVTLTGWSVLKATNPKYWMIPTVSLLLIFSWCWVDLARRRLKEAFLILILFSAWNGFLFQDRFVKAYERDGATGEVYRVWRLADSTRYYIPVLQAYHWLKERNCGHNPLSADDQVLLETLNYVRFMDQKRDPSQPLGDCQWGRNTSFYFGPIQGSELGSGRQRVEGAKAWGIYTLYY